MFLAAAVQLRCTAHTEANLQTAERLIRRAAGFGASLVVTPEATNYLGPHPEKVRLAESIDGPTIDGFRSLAAELRIHLVIGSFNERFDDQRCYNTSVVITPEGELAGSYRKIHLFDVDVSEDVRFKESDTVKAGDTPAVVQTELGPLGMSICYDLRFPEMYRHLTDAGAKILLVPSAFTLTTGKDHWEPLLRARAIENQCYVIAPGQFGEHGDGGLRHSWGHSMIIDPWGHVVALASDGPSIALAEIDLAHVDRVRRGMPVASHRRLA